MRIDFTSHGVLTDTHLITRAGDYSLNGRTFLYASDLFTFAYFSGLKQLWILPGSKLSKNLTVKKVKVKGKYKFKYTKFQKEFIKPRGGWTADQEEIKYTLINGRGLTGARVQIIAPGIIPPANALDSITDARELFAAVSDLQHRLNVEITVPIITAKKLLYSTLKREIAPCTSDMSPFVFNNELDLMWTRELTDEEKKLNYLHVYDKTHAYLSSCGLELGQGNYEYFTGRAKLFTSPSVGIPVGLYRVSRISDCPTALAQFINTDGWFYSPMLELLRHATYVEIEEAYTWRNTARTLDAYYKILRREIKPDERGQPINAFLKAMFRQFFGWLGRLKGKDGDALYRPDWRCLIISQTKANIIRNVLSVYEATGIMPAFISVDSVGYLSDCPNYQDAIPFPFTGVNPKTGAASPYRHNFTLEAAKAIPVLTSGESMTEIYKTLRATAKEDLFNKLHTIFDVKGD